MLVHNILRKFCTYLLHEKKKWNSHPIIIFSVLLMILYSLLHFNYNNLRSLCPSSQLTVSRPLFFPTPQTRTLSHSIKSYYFAGCSPSQYFSYSLSVSQSKTLHFSVVHGILYIFSPYILKLAKIIWTCVLSMYLQL